MIGTKGYSVRVTSRGEEIVYTDNEVHLNLEMTCGNWRRIFCDGTLGRFNNLSLAFAKRREIILNLCDFFKTTIEPVIFVVHDRDRDRAELARLFEELKSQGHHIRVEDDSDEKQQKVMDDMMIRFLEAGKPVTLNGQTFRTVEEYRGRKQPG